MILLSGLSIKGGEKRMKYIKAEMELVELDSTDVITTSEPSEGDEF